jgi:hypothetical protein
MLPFLLWLSLYSLWPCSSKTRCRTAVSSRRSWRWNSCIFATSMCLPDSRYIQTTLPYLVVCQLFSISVLMMDAGETYNIISKNVILSRFFIIFPFYFFLLCQREPHFCFFNRCHFPFKLRERMRIARDYLPPKFTMAASQKSPRSLFFKSVEILVKSERDWGHNGLSELFSGCFFFSLYFFQIFLFIFYNTICIPAVIQGWARPCWVVTPAPGLHRGGGDWVRIEPRTENQQSPGENQTRDWTSTVQRANHWATLHPQFSGCGCHVATETFTVKLWTLNHYGGYSDEYSATDLQRDCVAHLFDSVLMSADEAVFWADEAFQLCKVMYIHLVITRGIR